MRFLIAISCLCTLSLCAACSDVVRGIEAYDLGADAARDAAMDAAMDAAQDLMTSTDSAVDTTPPEFECESVNNGECFKASRSGQFVTCALDGDDDNVWCWTVQSVSYQGIYEAGSTPPPMGPFRDLSIGTYHLCGLRFDGFVECWGYGGRGATDAPEGAFTVVGAGDNTSCGLKDSGALVCWGQNRSGEGSPPDGIFLDMSTGEFGSCAIRDDRSVSCWGNLSSPDPTLRFGSLSAGTQDACGITVGGEVRCWGGSALTAPTAPIVRVEAGTGRACGLTRDGDIFCWGEPLTDGLDGLDGPFVDLSTRGSEVCGVREGGSLVCVGTLPIDTRAP